MRDDKDNKGGNGGADEKGKMTVLREDLTRIACVIEAAAGDLCEKNERIGLAVAQSMRDMTESGKFGSDLDRVLIRHFPPPVPPERLTENCIKAAEEVFVKGRSRCEDWKIFSFARISENDGIAGGKSGVSAGLLLKYDCLGFDQTDGGEGLIYFGKRRIYMLEVGRFLSDRNAKLLCGYLSEKLSACRVAEENGKFVVLAGAFRSKSAAEAVIPALRSFGIRTLAIRSDFQL